MLARSQSEPAVPERAQSSAKECAFRGEIPVGCLSACVYGEFVPPVEPGFRSR